MTNDDSIGLDAASTERQEASAGGEATPIEKKEEEEKPDPPREVEETKKEEAIQAVAPPPEETAPAAVIQEKPPEKAAEVPETKVQPSNPAPAVDAQEEQRAASRDLEARRNQVLSLYNSKIYQVLMRHAVRPRSPQKGRVVIELTISPTGDLLSHRIVESSGSDTLDRTAMLSLERAAPFPAAPAELGRAPHTVRVPFEYAVK
jgi:protein TonB